jgi:hypothetical protein
MNPQYPGNQGQMPPTGYGQPPIGQGQRPPGPPQNMYNGQSMNQLSGQPGIEAGHIQLVASDLDFLDIVDS